MRRHLERETALRAAALALLAFAAIGCQTIDDVRSYEPIRSGTFVGDYKSASGCTANAVLGRHQVSQVIREDQRTAVLLNSHNSDFIYYEATFREIARDRFTVEMRSGKGVWGTEAPTALVAWSALESCAAKA